MDPIDIIAAVTAIEQATRALAPVLQKAWAVMHSSDQAAVKAALVDLEATSDVLHASTQEKLRGAPAA